VAYRFQTGIDPLHPRDLRDQCPSGWDTVIEDARDRSAQFWGCTPAHLAPYIEWERRELALQQS
jgi:hypothetical protein